MMDKDYIDSILVGKTDSTLLQLFRYTFVGGFAFVVDFALLYVLTDHFRVYYLTSAALSFTAGLIVNYVLSKLWVFNKSSFKNRWVEFLIFAIIGIVGLFFTEILMWLFTSVLSIYYILSKIITTMIVYFWNFFARKIIIF